MERKQNKLRIKLEGETTDALDERAAAETEIADIQERIVGQQSEQLVNRVSLEKEASEAIQAIREEELKKLEEDAKEKEKIAEEARKKALEQAKEDATLAEEARLIDAANRMELLELQGASEFELNKKWLDKNKAEEIKKAKETGADIELINKKYDLAERKLNTDLLLFKEGQNAAILSGLSGLFKEGSMLGKAFALAEIANSTAINATKAFSQAAVFASNPLTLPLAANANIQGGIIIATGIAQAAKTSGLKLSEGGRVTGKGSGKSDSIPAWLSNGESVNNANSTRMFAPLYSYLNVLGGGKRFAPAGS